MVDADAPLRQFPEQLHHGGRYLTVSWYDNCPSQVLSEFSGDDMPSIERTRCCRSDLNHGPVSNERECNVSARQWTAHDEMVVAMHQNTDHGEFLPQGADREPDNRSRNAT